jgi:hypothetical protein
MLRMNNEKRINHLLWLLMERPIHRYLMSNAEGRLDGAEKAEQHIQMSYIYVASRMGTPIDLAPRIRYNWYAKDGTEYEAFLYKHIHDETAENLTDYMDEVIGFPITGRPDYNDLAPKFFKEFLRIADKAYEEVKDDIQTEDLGRWTSEHLDEES